MPLARYIISSMNLETTQTFPLTVSEDGTIRIKGSRVTLDSIVHHFKIGSTPEEIAYKFPTVNLVDIYAAITYYLSHREEVEQYLKQQDIAAGETQKFIEAHQDTAALRERLIARAAKLKIR